VFWCCSVFCCVYSVLSTIIFPFFLGHRVLVLPNLLLSIWCSVHHYFPLLSWLSCVSVAQSFVVYMVFCPPLFSSSFLVIVFWCCPVFCCLYSVLSTIISRFFPGHRVLVLPSLFLSILCSVHHYFPPSFLVFVFWCCPVFCCLYSVLSTIISPSFLVIVFWCCPVFCCLYSVLSTIIFPLLSWSSCFGVAQSFVVYMVFCPPLFPSSFLVIVFWCCPVFCCLYGVLSTIIFLFFPGHRVLVLLSLLLSIWCSVHHYFPLLSWSSCFGVAQSFVVYMVFCPPLFTSSFLVIVC
jgi:hypothetical protein